MFWALLTMGGILGIFIGVFIKFASTGYGYSNDMENQPIIRKSCRYCNERISRDYKKNLCPNCRKPLE